MPNAIDMFRAQRDAAEQVHQTLQETARLLHDLHAEVDALATDPDLRALLRDERALLERAEAFLGHVRYVREQEIARFGPTLWRRWALALAFALASATAAGAGSTWIRHPAVEELAALRARCDRADAVYHRILAMTPAQRRQLDALLKTSPSTDFSR